TLAINDTKLKSIVLWNAGGVNATSAQFVTANGTALNQAVLADAFTISNQISDAVDAAGLGVVRIVPDRIYVTTTSGSIQRGINAASVGDTVYVAPGAYAGTVAIDKVLTVNGAKAGIAGSAASRGSDESIVQG
ncbi:MAG: hypothetical protein ACK46D_13440, partial [Roseiflexaceae bacterium]